MAIENKTLRDMHGEERKLYIRLNNFDQLANHGVPAIARFRGFASKEAFKAGGHYLWERTVTFDADIDHKAKRALWQQAYDALNKELVKDKAEQAAADKKPE